MNSYKIPSSEVPGYSAIYRNVNYKDGSHGDTYAHITTLYELFQHQVSLAPKGEFLGTRQFNPADGTFGKYEWLTATETAEMVEEFGSGLDHVFAKHAPNAPGLNGQQPLGLFSINRAEWLVGELSAFRTRRYSVGLCDTVGVEYSEHIVRQGEVSVVLAALDKIPRMLDRIAHTPGLRVIISMDRLDCSRPRSETQAFCAKTAGAELRARTAALGLVLLDMHEVIEMGRAAPTPAQPPVASDLCSLFFSSGTTGAQKGVLAPHSTLVHASRAAHLTLKFKNTTYLSFSLLAHCLDRCAMYMCMYGGARIGFYNGDNTRILEDMQVLKPNVIVSLPVVFNRLYDGLAKATIQSAGIKGALCRMGLRSKVRRMQAGRGLQHGLWDRVVFSKVAAKFGGQMRAIIAGGSPSRADVMDFLRVALSCDILQGYGQCESMTAGTLQRPGDFTNGHVGVPSPGIDIRLRSVAETGHLVTDAPCPRGELQMRGHNVLAGYLNDPEKTRALKDGDWLITGDIAQINANGTISILDRTGHFIRTSACYSMSPDRIQDAYNSHRLIQASFVHAQSTHAAPIAVAVPDADAFVPWARGVAGQPAATLDALCASPAVAKALLAELRAHAAAAGLLAEEQAAAIHVEPVLFSAKNCGLTTLTHKLRRRAFAEHYAEQIKALFAEVDELDKEKK